VQGTPALVVDARGATPRLAWNVTTTGTQADGTPSEQRVTVDAATGRVLVREETVETATGSGNGYFSGTVPLETTLASGTYQLKDATRGGTYTTDMRNRTKGSGTLFTDADNLWGNGTTSDRASIGVDAQYGTNMTWDFYRTTFGRTGIRGDGAGSFNRAHYGRNYDNAFWQDSCFCMTYGDGDGRTYKPFTELDVAGHEMSHGVTAATANLTYSGESGGLNEATSDIFGTLVEFYAANANDPADYLIGERLRYDGRPLRWMDDPSKDGASASCWSSTVGGLNVHYSSGVANHFFYLLAVGSGQSAYGNSPTCNGSTVAGIGNGDAGRIWYRALTTYMTSSTNYKGARTATLQAASDLFGATSAQRTAVDRAWAAVNVT
jgi:Zn-dependent metalloprotease